MGEINNPAFSLPILDSSPNTLLRNTSYNTAQKLTQRLKVHAHTKQPLTAIKDFEFKPVVLVTDNPIREREIIKRTRYVSLLPIVHHPRKEFLKKILYKTIYVCISKKGLENEEYVACLVDLIKMKSHKFRKESEVIAKMMRITALLLDGPMLLPSELNELFPLVIKKETAADHIAKLLERTESSLLRVETLLKEADLAPRQKIFFRIHLPGAAGDEVYLRSSWHALLETFEDVGSVSRQHLLQLLHISNVETRRRESDIDRHLVCIEIQPNNIDDYLNFLEFYHSNKFQSLVQNNLKVNMHSFIGNLQINIDAESAINTLKYFIPKIIKCKMQDLRTLVAEGRIHELLKLIRKETKTDASSEHVVQCLAAMCATMIYEAFLKKRNFSPFEYLRFFKKAGCPDYLIQIRTSDGYNALHLAVKYEREDFMKMLFYANKWGFLRKDIVKPVNVKPESLHVGYIPRRVAEALSFSNAGFEILKQFDEYEDYLRYMPLLHKACLMGLLAPVSQMIQVHPGLVQENDENDANCLHYACASGNGELVEYLLKNGAQQNKQNRSGEMPNHMAAMFGHLNVLRVLSNNFFEIRGIENNEGYNALHYAVRFGDTDVLKLYKERKFTIDAKSLTIAAKHQCYDVFDLILQEDTDVNEGRDCEERLALHYSVMNGNAHMVKQLIKKKADITLVDKYNENVLHLAASHGEKGILKILIDEAKKADCLKPMISAKNVFTDRDLLVVIRGKDRGRKAWHWIELKRLCVKAFGQALKLGQVDVVKYGQILKSGFGTYPDDECVQLMEKRLADILNERKSDMTPLHVATFWDHPDIVEILLRNGASPDDQDYKGATALHYAVMNDNIQIMHHLCSAGASLDIKTADGQTVFDLAQDLGSTKALNFLHASTDMEVAKTFMLNLSKYVEVFSLKNLLEKRNSGLDIRMYIIEALRDLNIDINCTLLDLGSSPVQEVRG